MKTYTIYGTGKVSHKLAVNTGVKSGKLENCCPGECCFYDVALCDLKRAAEFMVLNHLSPYLSDIWEDDGESCHFAGDIFEILRKKEHSAKTWKSCELPQEEADNFKTFLHWKGITFSGSSCYNNILFQILGDEEDFAEIENYLGGVAA